jgi:hypothetical protein
MDLKGREIFAVGTWNGMDFTPEDLEDIVANFNLLNDTHKVPLKFGHNKEQKITDGQPAIGWISKLIKQGDKLFADFTDMPKVVFEAIKNKLYRTVSVELLFNVSKETGERFNHVLDAVALLGADKPAVSGLADLDALLATRTEFVGGHRVAFETIAGTSKKFKSNDSKEQDMDEKQIQALIDKATNPLVTQITELTRKNEEKDQTIAQFKADQEKAKDKEAKDKVAMARQNVTTILDAAVRNKTMLPAFRETYEKQIGLADDERVLNIDVDEIKAMFGVTKIDTSPIARDKGDDDDADPGAKLLSLTHQYQAKHGEKDFSVAFTMMSQANPEVHRAYLDSNGEA